MKQIALVLALLGLCACSKTADFHTIDGKPGSYQDFQGKWLAINYWADWCKPCIKEIPELNALNQKNNIQVVGIHYDRPAADVQLQHAQQLHIEFPVLLASPDQHYGFAYPNVLPTTAIISPQGKLVKLLFGPQTVESIEAEIQQK